jgi:membrane-bound lytic murein transglycosylase MltF
MHLTFKRGLAAILFVASAHAALAQQPAGTAAPAAPGAPRKMTIANKPWIGDFDKMLERRVIRVYAPFSRSLYFNDKGRERGLAVELVRDWERYINVKYAKELGKRPLTIYIGPATRDNLLPYLSEGLADVSIGNLTVTDERLKVVDFVPGDEGRKTINEVIVTGPKSPPLKSLDDLAGKRIHVRKASSYYESLETLNERFKREGKSPMVLILVPGALEDEDLMDMESAGLIELLVVGPRSCPSSLSAPTSSCEPTPRPDGRFARTAPSSRRKSTTFSAIGR